jgi:hypothetical protein
MIAIAMIVIVASTGCNSGGSDENEAVAPRVGIDVWSRYSASSDRIALLLQPRQSAAELFAPTLGDELRVLGEKLQKAAEADPYHFLTLVGNTPDDEVPPFDPRLGLTREEYDDLMFGTHVRLKKTGDTAVTIVSRPDERFVITGMPGLKEVVIDAALQTVGTSFGDVLRPVEVKTDAPSPLTGPLVGYRWSEPSAAGALRRYRLREITLGQSPADGAVWFVAYIIDTLDNRPVVECYARFAGPKE